MVRNTAPILAIAPLKVSLSQQDGTDHFTGGRSFADFCFATLPQKQAR